MSGFVVGVKEGRVVEHSLFSYFSDHCTYDFGKLNINLSQTRSDTLHPWEDAHDLVLEQGPELVLGEAGLDVELDVHVAVLLHLPGHRQHLVLHLNTRSLVYTPQNMYSTKPSPNHHPTASSWCHSPTSAAPVLKWGHLLKRKKSKIREMENVSIYYISTHWCRKCGRVWRGFAGAFLSAWCGTPSTQHCRSLNIYWIYSASIYFFCLP